MAAIAPPFNYHVDDEATPLRVAKIRDAEVPSGILATPVNVRPEDRALSEKAVRTVAGLFDWAEAGRRDAEKD